MKRNKYILPAIVSLCMVSCSVEAPFESGKVEGTGELSKYAFDIDASVMETTRATSQDIVDDFSIVIQKTGTTPTPAVSYQRYAEMPEVVTLEAGSYKAIATYGENKNAAFEQPYYLGESDEFKIEPNKITTNIGDIVCKLENVKVTINFHSSLYNSTDENAYVEVYVNKDEALKFSKDETRAGYFKHSDVCTLTATFHGIVDGVELHEVKTLDNVNKGNHYSLTFAKHIYTEDNENGELGAGINVMASVTIVNMNENITIAEDEILKDDERPKEDDPSTGDDPGKEDPEDPDGPENPDVKPEKPSITACEGIDLDSVNTLEEGMPIILNIISGSPITSFFVKIDSTDQGFMDAIEEMIGKEFDLITLNKEEGLGYSLSELGFPVGEDVSNPAEKDENGNGLIKFEITPDLQMLLVAYEGTHEFSLKVTNAEGTSEVTLKLQVNQ